MVRTFMSLKPTIKTTPLTLARKKAALTGIKRHLEEAVEVRLHCDADLGFLLVGGLDSSLVCAIAQRKLKNLSGLFQSVQKMMRLTINTLKWLQIS